MEKRYLTPTEVQELYGLNKQTLANMRSLGKGPRYYKIGRLVRYAVQDLEKYFQGRDVRVLNN